MLGSESMSQGDGSSDSVYATKATRVPRAMKGAKGMVPARRESRSCSVATSRMAPLKKGSLTEGTPVPA